MLTGFFAFLGIAELDGVSMEVFTCICWSIVELDGHVMREKIGVLSSRRLDALER